ncbi:PKD domain-containing protein [Marinifilum caeruleilacunae]|uniref:PKD domain-containing protein n=1 Tax=Marinifilum caeruleilacunae TaxID=2499076 RepID=A0ABX1WXE0_9BACT|nr:PKD domain-containing protein [Marinifilum caeruleilacunae]NOU60776.1 PKD domain-containing protein [Marinifilum caeruleilacunae]
MTFKIFRSGLLLSLIILSGALKAQISHGGEPIFKYGGSKNQLVSLQLPNFELLYKNTIATSTSQGIRLKNAQYAHAYKVNYNSSEHGIWEILKDGRKVWRLSVKSENAFSLGLIFSKFKLPEGGQLFVYNSQSNRVLGAYTHENNKKSGRFSIEPLQGDELVIEYIEPKNVGFSAELRIESILHDYKNIFNLLKGESSVKASGSCNVDINCPEGNDWQTEKKSVCHILYNGWIASGALINNTRQDGTPYLLTAYHVIHEQENADIAIFYFNYENSGCMFEDAERSQSISGSTLRATTSNLDFSLLELSVVPPASYTPYYAGWDRSGRIPANTTSIHHPSGDAKKISIDNDSPVTATYSDARYTFDDNTSWQILDWEVGTTEGGSSGSPLFDENHRIIGDLTGGDASCSNSVNDYYAKFSSSWENYPNSNEQLKFWLDPLGLGVETLDGFDPYGGFLASFNLSADTICHSSSISVTDFSSGDPDSFEWHFGDGASPQNANTKGPHTVNYSTTGMKEIKLIVEKDGVKDSIVKNVLVMDLPIVDFDYQLNKLSVNLVNASIDATSYSWNFGDGGTSEEANPVHSYSNSGTYTISLNASNICGSVSLNKEIKTSYNDQLKIYPNPSNGKFSIDLSKIVFSELSWSVFSTQGAEVKNGLVSEFTNILEFNLNGLSGGVYILRMNVDGEVLTRKLLLVE